MSTFYRSPLYGNWTPDVTHIRDQNTPVVQNNIPNRAQPSRPQPSDDELLKFLNHLQEINAVVEIRKESNTVVVFILSYNDNGNDNANVKKTYLIKLNISDPETSVAYDITKHRIEIQLKPGMLTVIKRSYESYLDNISLMVSVDPSDKYICQPHYKHDLLSKLYVACTMVDYNNTLDFGGSTPKTRKTQLKLKTIKSNPTKAPKVPKASPKPRSKAPPKPSPKSKPKASAIKK